MFGSSGIQSINHKSARGKYAVGPGEFDWLLQVIWRITQLVIWSTDKFAICKTLDSVHA